MNNNKLMVMMPMNKEDKLQKNIQLLHHYDKFELQHQHLNLLQHQSKFLLFKKEIFFRFQELL